MRQHMRASTGRTNAPGQGALGGIALAMLLGMSAPARAQGRLEGTILSPAGPLTSLAIAQVRLSDGQRAFVDSLGHFRFDSVPPGRITATAEAGLYAPDAATVVIRSGRTTRHDFLLHVDSFWVVKHEAKWLECGGAPSGVRCIPPRGLLAERWGFRAGAWLFGDSTALSRFWLEHAPTNTATTVRRLSPIDWSHEDVVAVSYGSYSGCGPRRYVNRIELRADTTVVVVGEDSLYEGPPRITCAAVVASTDFVIIPRAHGAVVVRPANPGSGLRPLVVEVPATPAAGHTPVAVVRADAAEFTFPLAATRQFISTREDIVRGYSNQNFIWAVRWEVNGVPDFGIEARSGAPRGIRPGQDTLEAVVATARLWRAEPTDAGDLPAVALSPEGALAAVVRDRHVVLTLRGRDVLRRLWPNGPPDTVTFFWRGPGAQLEGKKVPLVRRR